MENLIEVDDFGVPMDTPISGNPQVWTCCPSGCFFAYLTDKHTFGDLETNLPGQTEQKIHFLVD